MAIVTRKGHIKPTFERLSQDLHSEASPGHGTMRPKLPGVDGGSVLGPTLDYHMTMTDPFLPCTMNGLWHPRCSRMRNHHSLTPPYTNCRNLVCPPGQAQRSAHQNLHEPNILPGFGRLTGPCVHQWLVPLLVG